MEPTLAHHISVRPEVCGGKPCIAGTRIRVWDIHIMYDVEGRTPAEIVSAYPQLSLADVHAGLAYFLDHRQDIEDQMAQAEAAAAKLESEQGITRFTELRDAFLRQRRAGTNDDPVSPG